ncbi:MAG: adenine-specific methyltransferase EcoRI family protein [Gracilimonas sp.]
MNKNKNLHGAKSAKQDEFYTQLSDIEKELQHYTEHFRDKIVYCNCDSEDSNFWIYFRDNFERLGLKKLISTHYDANGNAYKIEMTNEDN